MKKKIFVIGASGSVGSYFLKSNEKIYELFPSTKSSQIYPLNLNSMDSILNFKIPDFKFDHILFLSGINPRKNLKEISPEEFMEMFFVNVLGPSFFLKNHIQMLNPGGGVLFISSVAAEKGSYDPSYASSKAALSGLVKSLTKEFNAYRFNILSLGLIENSRVYDQMSPDFVSKHKSNMRNNKLISLDQVNEAIKFIIENDNIANSNIPFLNSVL